MRNKSQYLIFAISLARAIGRIQMVNRRKAHRVEWNDSTHFRTEVDLKIALRLRHLIGRSYPNHNIYSEELPEKVAGNAYTWVADETDGTGPYFWGGDHFSFAIALYRNLLPLFGVINVSARKELYYAEVGKGAFCNDDPIRVNTNDNMNRVRLAVDPGKHDRTRLIPFIERAYADDGVAYVLSGGCATVPLCFVASGRWDAYLATGMGPEDMAAAAIIIREAGGKVTDLQGRDWTIGSDTILAANPILHEKLFDKLVRR